MSFLLLSGLVGWDGVLTEDRVLTWGLASLQTTQFYSEKNIGYSPFYRFCDYVEGMYPVDPNATVPGEDGVGLEKALEGYARYIKEDVVTGCVSPISSGRRIEANNISSLCQVRLP